MTWYQWSGCGSESLVGRAPELRHHTDGVHDYGATKGKGKGKGSV